MFSELWIDPADVSPLVSGTLHRDAPVRIRFADSAVNLPDRVARGLVHALLAHYAGKVDFHLIEPSQVEAVDRGLRASLKELDREANNEDSIEAAQAEVEWELGMKAFHDRPTP